MIKATNLSFGFPQKDLYHEICFEIAQGDHAVLIGSNGTGKSTLVEMILDPEKYLFDGKLERDLSMRIGYVSQYTSHEGEENVYDFLADPFVKILEKSDAEAAKLAAAEDMEAAMEEYQKLLDEIDAMDAYNYDTNVKKQAAIAGLENLLESTVDKISGGEYKLLAIIREMLTKPQLLIMDEPDVFLDFENLVGLSKLINAYEGTILVISHNRLLLGQCFDKILHLENAELQEFPGTFAEYTRQMLETKTLLQEQAAKDEEWIEIQQKLVERLRAKATLIASAKRGAQVHARATYLERLQARKAKNPFVEDRQFALHFPQIAENLAETTGGEHSGETTDEERAAETAGNEVLIEMKDYSLSFDRSILSDVNFTIRRGEKVALVGANGTGKSSMLKDIVKKLQETTPAGDVGYFSQIYESAEKLSGGEKNVKQLMALADSKAKILVLDEPTSHLDTYAQIALEDAVREYQGTILLVTHDFYVVANCVDRILMIADGTVREMSARAFRKSIYRTYFTSDVFEKEREQKELELRVNGLLKKKNYREAKALLGLEEEE